jgi:NAD+ synthetase
MTSNSMNFESASQEIIDFIKKETEVRESKGIVLGMSGGIDSTVLAYLATRAIGSKNVKGLILPDESVTPPDDIEDALTICSILNIDYEKMSINKPKDSFLEMIKYKNDTLLAGNLVARIRMSQNLEMGLQICFLSVTCTRHNCLAWQSSLRSLNQLYKRKVVQDYGRRNSPRTS